MNAKKPNHGDSTTRAAARTASPAAYSRPVLAVTGRTSRNQPSQPAVRATTPRSVASLWSGSAGTTRATVVEKASMRNGSARMAAGS
jgi:hypothetical protein